MFQKISFFPWNDFSIVPFHHPTFKWSPVFVRFTSGSIYCSVFLSLSSELLA
jgi:hypothetical protein